MEGQGTNSCQEQWICHHDRTARKKTCSSLLKEAPHNKDGQNKIIIAKMMSPKRCKIWTAPVLSL